MYASVVFTSAINCYFTKRKYFIYQKLIWKIGHVLTDNNAQVKLSLALVRG
jgi:hypothetical protein